MVGKCFENRSGAKLVYSLKLDNRGTQKEKTSQMNMEKQVKKITKIGLNIRSYAVTHTLHSCALPGAKFGKNEKFGKNFLFFL